MIYSKSDKYSEELLTLASAKIDDLTFNRITAIGFSNLTSFQKTKIEQATLLQAEYYDTYGTDAGSISSVSLLDMSISLGDGFSGAGTAPSGVSEAAYLLLKQTGLTYKGLQ